jgi:hypothetical protein
VAIGDYFKLNYHGLSMTIDGAIFITGYWWILFKTT